MGMSSVSRFATRFLSGRVSYLFPIAAVRRCCPAGGYALVGTFVIGQRAY
jgi:hypothetical protein